MARNPGIRAAREATRRETQELIAALRRERDDLQRQREASRREKAARDAERAEERRRGDHGPDLQAVQRRIDAGQTTWEDVVAGRDDHPSAQAVRANVTQNLDQLSRHLADDPDFVRDADALRDLNDQIDRESHRGR